MNRKEKRDDMGAVLEHFRDQAYLQLGRAAQNTDNIREVRKRER